MKAQVIRLDSHRKSGGSGGEDSPLDAVDSFRLARVTVQGDRVFVNIVVSSQEDLAAMGAALHHGVLGSRWWSRSGEDIEEKDWICLWLVKFSEPLGVIIGVIDPEETGLQPLVEMVLRERLNICYRLVHPDRGVVTSFDMEAPEYERGRFHNHSLRLYCSNDIEKRFGVNLCRALMLGVDTIWKEGKA